MVAINRNGEVVGHLTIEATHLATTRRSHILHAAHKLVLRDDNRGGISSHSLERDVILYLLVVGQLALKDGAHNLLLLGAQRHRLALGLANEVIHNVGIDTHETHLLVLRLVVLDIVAIQLTVHLQDIVALGLGSLDKRILALDVVGVEYHREVILVGLQLLDALDILLRGVVLTLDTLPEHEAGGLLGKLLVGEHAVLYKYFEVIPLALIGGAHRGEELLQAVGHLACDISRNLLHVRVALQIATRDVERDVGRVDNAMQQRQILRHDTRYLVGHEDLVRVQLYAVFLNVEVRAELREVEHAREVEGVVDIQMYVE